MSEPEVAESEPAYFPSHSVGLANKVAVSIAVIAITLAVVALRVWEQNFSEILVSRAGIKSGLSLWIAVHAAALASCIAFLAALVKWRSKSRTTFNGVMVLLTSVLAMLQTGGLAAAVMAHEDTLNTYKALANEENGEMSLIEEGRVQILGPIGPRFMEDFALMRADQAIATIEITSEGGLLDQALALARVVEDDGISVVVRSYCFSACVAIAVSSQKSYADVDAVYGLHKSTPIADVKSEVAQWSHQQADQAWRDFLKIHGVPEDFLVESDKNEGESIFEVSARDMLDRGVIEGLVEGREIVAKSKSASSQ